MLCALSLSVCSLSITIAIGNTKTFILNDMMSKKVGKQGVGSHGYQSYLLPVVTHYLSRGSNIGLVPM